jgi:uncharacterized membrane protein HdeD (DUF308 family)
MLRTILILFAGIALVVAGTAVVTHKGFTLTTAERQLVHLGPITAGTEESNWTIAVPPIIGAVLLVGGAILVFGGALWKRAPHRESGSVAPSNAHAEPFHG